MRLASSNFGRVSRASDLQSNARFGSSWQSFPAFICVALQCRELRHVQKFSPIFARRSPLLGPDERQNATETHKSYGNLKASEASEGRRSAAWTASTLRSSPVPPFFCFSFFSAGMRRRRPLNAPPAKGLSTQKQIEPNETPRGDAPGMK